MRQTLLSEPAFTIFSLLLDLAACSGAVALALAWANAAGDDMRSASLIWLFPPLVILAFIIRRLYRRQLRARFLDELEPVQTAVAMSALLLLTLMLVVGDNSRPGALVVRVWLGAAVLMSVARLARALIQRHARRQCRVGTPTLVVGAGHIGHQIVRRLDELPEYGLRPVGFLDRTPATALASEHGVRLLGEPADLANVAMDTRAQHVIVAFASEPDERLVHVARMGHDLGMDVSVVPRLFDTVGERVRVEHLGGLPLLNLDRVNPRGWQFAVKHAMDRTVAGVGIILLSPLLIALALAVKFSSPGPILYRQRRIGRDGQPFDVLKFRSMRPPRKSGGRFQPKAGSAPGGVEGEDRRTPIGKFMRRTSLDELPQLFNVFMGDMSLVGPRPERPEFVELFQEQIRRYGERHRVKAGITGWAQVHGLRGQTSIADRAEWDNYYIENWSLGLDLKTLALTFLTLFRRSED